VFRTILERCADAGGKILTVHSVRNVPMVLDMIERHLPRNRGVVVLHWFTGTKAEARRAATLGRYFSINAEMMRSDRGRALVDEIPIDRLLTETDGPFTQIDGRSTEPTDARKAIHTLARVRNVAVDAVDKAVRANLQTLLK
jgi:TatD DNase family protein